MDRRTTKFGDRVLLPIIPMAISTKKELDDFHKIKRDYEDNTILLAEYEDTGLSPAEIATVKANYEDFCEMQCELAELKTKLENGMLVELPCKVGDKVKVLCDSWGNVWNYKTIDYGKFLVGEIISITITKKQVLMKIQVEHNVEWKRERRRYPISALGKTVFLTLADAENKLNEGVE